MHQGLINRNQKTRPAWLTRKGKNLDYRHPGLRLTRSYSYVQNLSPVVGLPLRSRLKSFRQSWSLPRLQDFLDKTKRRGSTVTMLEVRKEPLHQVGWCSGSNTGFCCLCRKIATNRNPIEEFNYLVNLLFDRQS